MKRAEGRFSGPKQLNYWFAAEANEELQTARLRTRILSASRHLQYPFENSDVNRAGVSQIEKSVDVPRSIEDFERLYGELRRYLALKQLRSTLDSNVDAAVLDVLNLWFRKLKPQSFDPEMERVKRRIAKAQQSSN